MRSGGRGGGERFTLEDRSVFGSGAHDLDRVLGVLAAGISGGGALTHV